MSTFPTLPWMDTEVRLRMIKQQDIHLFGCLTVLEAYAGPSGEIAYSKAVDYLTASPDMSERKAKKALARLVEAGWVTRTGEVISITGYGSRNAPDYVRKTTD